MKRHMLEIFVLLALFGAYAVSATLLSAIGASVYQAESANIENNYDMRTGALYISEKVRQNDSIDSIRTDLVSGSDALVLTENKSGRRYEIWIYVYEGFLREILVPPESQFRLSAGQIIMPLKRIDAEINEAMLNITLTMPNSEIAVLRLFNRSAREVKSI